jgi:cyclic pyranopterin phosphate synthase
MKKLSHIAADGSVSMVDISAKKSSTRSARAAARLRMSPAARKALQSATLGKGNAFAAAQIAGISAAKQTATLIPLAHSIALGSVEITFEWRRDGLTVQAEARTHAPTGVEMEALIAVSIAALTIYDMTKAVDKGIRIESIALLEKAGGKSGSWKASR